ncbi:uncharacterized protein LOC129293042 [Prosopis cineraria]|uniref:uncharacterized protein LOC129293042 n=1 Tax=Prosopis cineraria TaxID=364024 RepID=UPI00240F909F|nr:uncharacterized protein LOC129293042 [Prosopis cineraria]
MLGFTTLSQPSISPPFFPASTQILPRCCNFFPFPSSSFPNPQPVSPRKPIALVVFAENDNGPNELKEGDKPEQDDVAANGGKDNSSKDRRPIFDFDLRSLLDPDPDNVLALCLTGLLTWASVQVLLQLCFISLAILLAALKYSFIAALLVFILITLL